MRLLRTSKCVNAVDDMAPKFCPTASMFGHEINFNGKLSSFRRREVDRCMMYIVTTIFPNIVGDHNNSRGRNNNRDRKNSRDRKNNRDRIRRAAAGNTGVAAAQHSRASHDTSSPVAARRD